MADYRAYARRRAQIYGLDPDVFEAQIGAESQFRRSARSPAGALGIAQIMPDTARGWGVDPMNPRAALDAAARNMATYVRKYGSVEAALRAYNAGPGAIEASKGYAETNAYVRKILGASHGGSSSSSAAKAGAGDGPTFGLSLRKEPAFDQTGYDAATRKAIVARLLARRHGQNGILFKSGALSTDTPLRSDFMTSRLALGGAGASRSSSGGSRSSSSSPSSGGHGTATYDGKKVAEWMVPALRWAREHGWKGTITSGVRTRAEQQSLWDRWNAGDRGGIVRQPAKPGESNHEVENGGAVDVSDPDTLARILHGYRGRKLIQGTAINDPVHFSATGR